MGMSARPLGAWIVVALFQVAAAPHATPLDERAEVEASVRAMSTQAVPSVQWTFDVLGLLSTGEGIYSRFALPTAAACEAARAGVRELADTIRQRLLISRCREGTPGSRRLLADDEVHT
jgi:hypothetical protein